MYLKEQNGSLIPPPLTFTTPGGTVIENFYANEILLQQYGYKNYTQQELAQWYQTKQAATPLLNTYYFDQACRQFREICSQIGAAIGKPDFKGGFDQMLTFAQSPVYSTVAGLQLAVAWAAANQSCQHEAAKLGIYKPGDATWWYMMWQQEPPKEGIE